MSKWTKGPWRVNTDPDSKGWPGPTVVSVESGMICDLHQSGELDKTKRSANASLIAAAPEMAELLERAMLILREHAQYDGEDVSAETEIAQAARALLARIEGE